MPASDPAAVENDRNLLALLHIRRPSNDLNLCAGLIHCHLAHNQLIRIRVLLDLFNFPHYNFI